MQLKINGQTHEVALEHATVARLLDAFGLDALRGTAVAVNDRVVSRSQWETHELSEGDRIEVIRATQGG